MNKFRDGESRRLSDLTQNARRTKEALEEPLGVADILTE